MSLEKYRNWRQTHQSGIIWVRNTCENTIITDKNLTISEFSPERYGAWQNCDLNQSYTEYNLELADK